MLAVDGTGVLHALGKDAGGTISHGFQAAGGGWTTESILSPEANYNAGASAFEIGPDGTPHTLIETSPAAYALARGADGQWTIDSPTAAQNFTLDATGAEITFEVETDSSSGVSSIGARRGVTSWPAFAAGNGADFRVTQGMAAPLTGALAPFAVATYDGNALHLVWPTPAGSYTDVGIPNTPATVGACTGSQSSGCSGTCVDQEYGLESRAFSLGRTDDGAAWLGYLSTHVDRTCSRTPMTSDSEQFCICVLTDDRSTGELHLLRGAPDGTQPVEALVLPLEPEFIGDLSDDLPLIHIRAFGTRVAVAARVHATLSPSCG